MVLVDFSVGIRNVKIIKNCNAPELYVKGADVCLLLSPDREGLANVTIEYCILSLLEELELRIVMKSINN